MWWLFDTSEFVTRSNCGNWDPWLIFFYQYGNLAIAISYFWIPVCILILYRRKRKSLPKSWILIMFAAFIFLCGITHIFDFTVFYVAPYRLYTVFIVLTATASIITAINLWPVISYYLEFKSPEEVDTERQNMIAAVKQRNFELIDEVTSLQNRIVILEKTISETDWGVQLKERAAELHAQAMNLKQIVRKPIVVPVTDPPK